MFFQIHILITKLFQLISGSRLILMTVPQNTGNCPPGEQSFAEAAAQ